MSNRSVWLAQRRMKRNVLAKKTYHCPGAAAGRMRRCNRLGWDVDASAGGSDAIRSVCEALVEHTFRWLLFSSSSSSLEYLSYLTAGCDRLGSRRCLRHYPCFCPDYRGRRDCSCVDSLCRLDVASRCRRGMCLPHSLCPVIRSSLAPICHEYRISEQTYTVGFATVIVLVHAARAEQYTDAE